MLYYFNGIVQNELMQCLNCKREFAESDGPRASISIFVMGDEYIYTYVYCAACGVYTVESYHDRFMGEDGIFCFNVDRALGDRAVELIRACPEPHNKYCDCESHRALYHGTPSRE